MKTYALITVHIVFAILLFSMSCTNPVKDKLQGSWTSKDGKTKLKVTDKGFAMDNNAEVPEQYFLKGDTIYTSFEGNQPYTKFVIQKLEPNRLTIQDPDLQLIEFTR
ncbi:hypothetical protein [Mucilaginibacter sp.]|uniref:hypothetical protein n=1 Tax=Mucilaginibacter sp. TaxID=1882438 RepID=UPI00261C22EE|nr:hypothetical protein [Mucilaginibacter sp.]MDB5030577.1 hypothetical protein [Mucilaginibacter sp.]